MSKSWAGLIMVGAALGLSASASHAAIISFENPAGPGHFDWNATAGHQFLTITADALAQPGAAGVAGTFERTVLSSGTQIRRTAGTTADLQTVNHDGGTFGIGRFVAGISAGQSIPTPIGPGLDGFAISGFVFRLNADPGFTQFVLPEGLQTYLGVRFDVDGAGPGGFNYGWIGVVRTGTEVDAFAWGYESDVGVPIAAGALPEPGSLSLFLIGSIAAVRDRRGRRT